MVLTNYPIIASQSKINKSIMNDLGGQNINDCIEYVKKNNMACGKPVTSKLSSTASSKLSSVSSKLSSSISSKSSSTGTASSNKNLSSNTMSNILNLDISNK